ncbi:MAG: family 78 glycoside hydrolase catalytic domain [Clostridia bacterium]|nr:family 78 glycoside hydrolase catalytic domain [Clostridia bacterium]
MEHIFKGKWITNSEFANLKPRNVFHKQLDKVNLSCYEHRNRHILFRKKFIYDSSENAMIYISADDYYKLYINGQFVSQGPAPSYHFNYNYNAIDVSKYLQKGENIIAVHTLYQGLINRVWQSGDNRHGLILDLVADKKAIVTSDESFKTSPHTGYTEMGICGYETQFLERYDSNSTEVGFVSLDFDDRNWENAQISINADHKLTLQKSGMLEFEDILPVETTICQNRILYDFGANYVGYLCVRAKGKTGDMIKVCCAQELNDDGTLRYNLRANCTYEEEWFLSNGESSLDWFDYKSFRYAELTIPVDVEIVDVYFCTRHYPFVLKTQLKPDYASNKDLRNIWDLCVHTQKYGVQEVIQDCMEREKGFYLGDGCYTALTNMILTNDDSMVRKLIDDAFSTEFITDTLVTCMCCSFMQEIAEYPLILVYLVLWHYNYTGNKEYLRQNYVKITNLLDAYRRNYEEDYLLRNLDKWCVVEWPKNFQHGYDVDIREGQICKEAHVSINAYYISAVRVANKIASILNVEQYRDENPLLSAFYAAFYDKQKNLFRDGENTEHISLVGNSFVYGFNLCSDNSFQQKFLSMLDKNKISSLSFFCVFPVLMGLVQNNRYDLIKQCLLDDGAWKRILKEGGTTTFEGWGKDTKWNTSLFHLTMSYAAIFMADIDLSALFFGF